MKKSLEEVLEVINKLQLDNKLYIDNSGIRWLDFAKRRICKLYGLSEEEVKVILNKMELVL